MCRHWTWLCLRAAFKLPVAKQPSCPVPSPLVLPSTISTSSGWWYHCPMPTNLSRYWKKKHLQKKNVVLLCVLSLFYTLISPPDLRLVYIVIYVCGGGGDSDFTQCHTALPSLIVWFHLSWLTCSCRPHKLTCLPSLWTLGLVGRANNTISFCTNYLMPTTDPSQLFSPHAHAHTCMETNTEGEREISDVSIKAS